MALRPYTNTIDFSVTFKVLKEIRHMVQSLTSAHWWLNWDREYNAWSASNLTVTASIQFTNKTQPVYQWTDPKQNSYNYGYVFAQHFGPKNDSSGIVALMEVGNEPWDYKADFYVKVSFAEGKFYYERGFRFQY